MKRTGAILLLVLLLGLAVLLHRTPRAEGPRRSPRPEVAAALPPEPGPAAVAAPEPPPPQEPPRPRPPVPPSVRPPELSPVYNLPGNAILRGSVKILGEPPPRKKIRMLSDPKCVEKHPSEVLKDDLVVDRDGGVKWAFVYIASGINNQPPKEPLPPLLLDQVGCMFEPHMLGIRTGQPLNIYNTDGILHLAHSIATDNREFNFGMTPDEQCRTVTFSQREVMVRLKCDIHPWMAAWIGVLDHPYFSVTSGTGSYGIPNLPAGRYVVQVWHEVYATVTREVDVPPGADVLLDFILDARKQ